MRKLLLVLFLVSAPSFSAPFLVADITPGTIQCGVFVDGNPKLTVPVTGTTCNFDLAPTIAGAHKVTMTAITSNDPVWGTQESVPSLPFSFVKPSTPLVPSGLRLSP